MVDRYFLPIPKNKAFNYNVHHKNYRMFAYLNGLGCILFSFQMARISMLRQTWSKPAGYYMDWNSPDAPKKVKYFA